MLKKQIAPFNISHWRIPPVPKTLILELFYTELMDPTPFLGEKQMKSAALSYFLRVYNQV